MQEHVRKWVSRIVAISMVAALVFQGSVAFAASLTSLSANASRLKENTNSDYTIYFVSPTGIQSGTSDDIILTFSSDFTLASEAAVNFDFAVGNSGVCTSATFTEETLALTASATEWGVDVTGDVVTFEPETDDTHAGGLCYRIKMGTNAVSGGTGSASTVQNGAADDDDTIVFSGGFGDTGTISVDITDDDQVTISATVAPSISFDVIGNSIEFGTLSSSAARYADASGGDASEVEAHTITAGTNATSGYIMYVSGATLTSGGSDTIDAIGGTNTAYNDDFEQFGVRFTATGGTGAVSAPYAASGFAYDGVSAPDEIATATGPTATTTYSARYLASIAAVTEAGLYSTTLTYTATATY